MRKLALAMFSLFAASAEAQMLLPEAPWSQEEYRSLLALQRGCIRIIDATSDAVGPAPDFLELRSVYSDAASLLLKAERRCLRAMQEIYAPKGSSALGKTKVEEAFTLLDQGISTLPDSADKRTAKRARDDLLELDTELAYANKAPAGYPRVFGSHGGYLHTLRSIAKFQREIVGAAQAVAELLHERVTPSMRQESVKELRKTMFRLNRAIEASVHMQNLTAFVISRKNADLLNTDLAHAGPIRDANFFRGILLQEYATGTDLYQPPYATGRPAVEVSVPAIAFASLAFANLDHGPASLVADNGKKWFLRQMTNGQMYRFRKQLFRAWQHSDNAVGYATMFAHPTPFPKTPTNPVGPRMPKAPWTQAEFDSLVNLVHAFDLVADLVGKVIAQPSIGAHATDVALVALQIHSAQTMFVRKITNMGSRRMTNTRAQQMRQAFNYVKYAARNLSRFADKASGQVKANAEAAVAFLEAFDPSLSYMNWTADDYPAVAGVHGDYDFSQFRLEHAGRYEIHVLWDLARLAQKEITPKLPYAERQRIARIAGKVARSARSTFRTISIEGFIIADDDWQRIKRDTRRASGLRPASFFRTMLGLEYSFLDASHPVKTMSGRARTPISFPNSMSAAMIELLDLAPRLAALNGGAEYMHARMSRNFIKIGDHRNVGLLSEAYQDTLDLWQGIDTYGNGVLGFFHGIPRRPRRPPIEDGNLSR